MNFPHGFTPVRFLKRALALSLLAPCALLAAESIDLSGTWRVTLDRANVGESEKWFARTFDTPITLPGSLSSNHLGDPVTVETAWTGDIYQKAFFTAPEYAPYREAGKVKIPFWLQPETHYIGAAWYQREIEVPAAWSDRHVTLELERPHWKTNVWLDEGNLGSNESLSTPHHYELGQGIAPGRHRLTIRIDNSVNPDIGKNSHSVTDHTQGNWNGVVGRIELRATAKARVTDLQLIPSLAAKSVRVRGRIATDQGGEAPASVQVVAGPQGGKSLAPQPATVGANGRFELDYSLGADAPPWDEFSPALHEVTVTFPSGEAATMLFGLREVSHAGRQLTLNGRPLFLRGTLECAAFPRTGEPPTDLASWVTEFRTIKAHGLNHIRFHSWCPPEAAFAAADQMGLYLQVEVASWPNWSTTLGDGKPVDGWIDRETARILAAYGNHPSFIILCAGNEPGGAHFETWLSGWVTRQKTADPRRLYTAGAGWPDVPENDLHVRSEPRIQHWGEGLKSRINQLPPETRTDYRDYIGARTVPVVSHEIGQWCVYPNFAEMTKYTGYLKPRNFEIFQASLAAHHLAAQAQDFLIASGKLQALCYKEDIESALRTPEMGGFQLLGLNDFPGQGTALVGVLDAFWEEKGYITSEAFQRFSGPTVPLARLDKRVFTTDEHLMADVDLAHYGAKPMTHVAAYWRLVADNSKTVAEGNFESRDVSVGQPTRLGHLAIALSALPAPARYRLVVSLPGTAVENDWDLWVYPTAEKVVQPARGELLIVEELTAAAEAKLAAGGDVWLAIPPERVAPDPVRGPVALGFSSIFWNTAWTNGQAPHTLGILCAPRHPALAAFPTESHSNWQWWYPVSHGGALILDGLTPDLKPIVQVIDDWVTNRKLGLVFEARVGRGRLLVTSIDLNGHAIDPVRRQLRASLLAYVAGKQFVPTANVTPAQLRALLAPKPAN